MRIATDLLDEIVAHARQDAPNECCGVLCGMDGEVTTVERAENEFASPVRYGISSDEAFRIYKASSERGEEMLAHYHSHPKSEAFPSPTDINIASQLPESYHVICSLADPDRPDVRAFAIREGVVEEVELDVG